MCRSNVWALSSIALEQIIRVFFWVAISIMSNGGRSPYRITSGQPPSPLHSSDSETTWYEMNQWRACVVRDHLVFNMRVPQILRGHDEVILNIAQYVWTCEQKTVDTGTVSWHTDSLAHAQRSCKSVNKHCQHDSATAIWVLRDQRLHA